MRIAMERYALIERPREQREEMYRYMESMLRRKYPGCALERKEIVVTRSAMAAQWGGRDVLNPCYGEGVVRCFVIATVDDSETTKKED